MAVPPSLLSRTTVTRCVPAASAGVSATISVSELLVIAAVD